MSAKAELLETLVLLSKANREQLESISAVVNNPQLLGLVGRLTALTKAELDRVKSVLIVKLQKPKTPR